MAAKKSRDIRVVSAVTRPAKTLSRGFALRHLGHNFERHSGPRYNVRQHKQLNRALAFK